MPRREEARLGRRPLQGAEEVANGFGVVEDLGAADFGEAESGVERVGNGIRRVKIDFADDARVAGGAGTFEEIGIEGAGVTFAARRSGNNDAIHINKPVIVRTEPEEIGAVVLGGLIVGEEERIGFADCGREEGLADEVAEFGESQMRKLVGVFVVESEQRFRGGVQLTDLRLG